MIGAIVGIIFGALWFIVPVPIALPVFGLALGANALVKERRAPQRNPKQFWLGIAAIVVGALASALMLFGPGSRVA